jgi:hypothetical protein
MSTIASGDDWISIQLIYYGQMSGRNRTGIVLLLALGACAKPQPWAKEGANAEQLHADERACEMAATQEVQRRQSKSVGTMGPAVVGPTTRRSTGPSGPFADQRNTQLIDEDQLVRACMHGKGYERAKPK